VAAGALPGLKADVLDRCSRCEDFMLSSSLVRQLATLPAWMAVAAVAQTPAPAAPDIVPPALPFHSAFEGYRAFDEAEPVPWPQANETVLRRGGWRTYARERETEAAPPRSSPSSPPSPPDAPAKTQTPGPENKP
jgi:hypothetical protein